MGIPGNEAADGEAKRGARPKETEEADIPDELPTLTYLKRINKRERKRIWENWWKENMPTRYRRWNLDTALTPKELQLSRPVLHRLLAERTGHGDFATYHERFHHPDADRLCRCGAERVPGHFVECELVQGKLPQRPPEGHLKHFLGQEGFRDFEWFLREASPFAKGDR